MAQWLRAHKALREDTSLVTSTYVEKSPSPIIPPPGNLTCSSGLTDTSHTLKNKIDLEKNKS